MKTSGLLDQLLKSGQDLLQKQQGSVRNPSAKTGGSLGDMLSGLGGPLGSVLGGGKGSGGRGAAAVNIPGWALRRESHARR